MVSATNLNITGEITGGGRNLTGGSLNLKVAVGQPIVGNVSSANLKICLGMFCGLGGAPPSYTVNFTGQLNYSNGTAITNTKITAFVTYLITNTYSQSNTTDSDGKFLIVVDTPNLQGKDFDVKFYVESEVEATYTCKYDPNPPYMCNPT